MNKQIIKQQLRRRFFALAIVSAVLALPLADAMGERGPASGDSTWCFNNIAYRKEGGHVFQTAILTIQFTGTFTGTFVGTAKVKIGFRDHLSNTHINGVFTGTVTTGSGTTKSGSVPWNGVGDFSTKPEKVVFAGGSDLLVGKGTGGLARFGARVTAERTGCVECEPVNGCEVSNTFTYSGRFTLFRP